MNGWIVNLRDAALERRKGAPEEAVQGLPPELAALYREMDGATLLGDVHLYPLEDAPFPGKVPGLWRFGQKGHRQLFTLPRAMVAEAVTVESHPSWLPQVPDQEWVYGVKEEGAPMRLFRTLESMLGVLVPPPVEEFGENTFARAFTAVQAALEDLSQPEAQPLERAKGKTKKPIAQKRVAPKPKPKKKPARAQAAKKKPATRSSKGPKRAPAKKPKARSKRPSPRGARKK